MALAEIIAAIRGKKQQQQRSALAQYLEPVRKLAKGEEVDADEVAIVLESTGRNEADLARDVELQDRRFQWARQRAQHQQALVDHQKAAADMQAAQRELQAAIDRLTPAVLSAEARMRHAEHITLTTASAEGQLMASENILDIELVERENVVTKRLREVGAELNPLKTDLGHKLDSLRAAEYELERIKRRDPGNVFTGVGAWFGQVLPNEQPVRKRIADLENQIAQLSAAIEPRQAELDKLTKELNAIHAEKLKP